MRRGKNGNNGSPHGPARLAAPAVPTPTWILPPQPGRRTMFTLFALADLVRRRKLLIFAIFAAVLGATALVVRRVPTRYESEMKLMVKRERTDGPIVLTRGEVAVTTAPITADDVTMEIEMLRSKDLLERVLGACGMYAFDARNAAERRLAQARALEAFQDRLKINPVRGTSLISIRYSDTDPALAQRVLRTLAAMYLETHARLHRNVDTVSFVRAQAGRAAGELQTAQQRLESFRRQGDVSLLLDQKQAALRRIGDLDASGEEVASQIREHQNRLRSLRSQRESLAETIETASRTARSVTLIERLKTQLVELEGKRTELLTRYEPGYRLVEEVEQQIRNLRAALDREQAPTVVDQTRSPNPLRQAVESEILRAEAALAGLEVRLINLTRDREEHRERLQKLEAATMPSLDLERDVKIAEENFLLYQKKQEEVRISEAMDQRKILNVAVVEPATLPALPAAGPAALLMTLGLLAGIFASFSAALVAEHFQRTPQSTALIPSPGGAVDWPRQAPDDEAMDGGERTTRQSLPV